MDELGDDESLPFLLSDTLSDGSDTPFVDPFIDPLDPSLDPMYLDPTLDPTLDPLHLDVSHPCPLCLKTGLNETEAKQVCKKFYAWMRHAYPQHTVDHYLHGTPAGVSDG